MDWKLLDYAKEAEDTASGLHIFLSEIPQYSRDITGNIAELFAISHALHTLHEALDLSHYGRYSARILRDLEVCLPSLGYTLDDVRDMFGKSKRNARQHPGAFPGTPPFDLIWQDSLRDLQVQGIALPQRLELFRIYLQGLHDILKGDPREEEIDHIRLRLSRLLKKQEPVDSYFNRLSVNPHGSRTPMPPTVTRPNFDRNVTYPTPYRHVPPLPPPPPPPPQPQAHSAFYVHTSYPPPPPPPPAVPPLPPRPPLSPVYGDIPFIPPAAPEIPQSPTVSTTSSLATSTHSSDSGGSVPHWAMKVFDGRHSSTPFKQTGQQTRCLGRDEPRAIELLDTDGFIKVLELPFEATNVWVRLYWRSDDNRARILFLTLDPSGRRMRYCFPLTGLKVLRTESSLQLCRVNRQDGQLDLWANLRFTLYERMVLFYCTFVAMKRQDETPSPKELEDFFQPGEKEEFGGEIQTDDFLHAFRVFRDRDSGCVRFEATARRGPHKTIPIWTAFVTQYIGYKDWMKRVGNSTVRLKQLRPYVFCEGFSPPKGPSGKYQLTFTSPQDCKNFMEMFHRIKVR